MAHAHKIEEAGEPKARTNVRATIIILGIMAFMIFAIAYTLMHM
jgi:hypothetical protein